MPRTTKRPSKKNEVTQLNAEPRHDWIATAAYFRAQRRNFENGDPTEDWLQAEAELRQQLTARA